MRRQKVISPLVAFFMLTMICPACHAAPIACKQVGDKIVCGADGEQPREEQAGNGSVAAFTEGYQNAKWGMSPDQVRAAFPSMNFKAESGGNLLFLSEISGEKVRVGFSFLEKRLADVLVEAEVKTTNKATYISKFNKFEDLLKKKYGEPLSAIRRGSDNQFIDDAMAIATGKGFYRSSWETSESTIILVLRGDNFELDLGIVYESKALATVREKANEEKAVNQL